MSIMRMKHEGLMDTLNSQANQFEEMSKTSAPGDLGPVISYWVSKGHTDTQVLLAVACELRVGNENFKRRQAEERHLRARPLWLRAWHFFTGIPVTYRPEGEGFF